MAAYIQLVSKATKQASTFIYIDEQMCKHFGVVPDEKRYFREWYDMICFPLALGQTFEEIRRRWLDEIETETDETMITCTQKDLAVLNWLEDHYEPQSWFGR